MSECAFWVDDGSEDGYCQAQGCSCDTGGNYRPGCSGCDEDEEEDTDEQG